MQVSSRLAETDVTEKKIAVCTSCPPRFVADAVPAEPQPVLISTTVTVQQTTAC